MILTDAGPIIALFDARDSRHTQCAEAVRRAEPPLLTSWPCFAEAMHRLSRAGRYRHDQFRHQEALWNFQESGGLVLFDLTAVEIRRMSDLMRQYQDTPMDLADASLIAAAESRALRQVFTFDNDFYIYRLSKGSTLEVLQ